MDKSALKEKTLNLKVAVDEMVSDNIVTQDIATPVFLMLFEKIISKENIDL